MALATLTATRLNSQAGPYIEGDSKVAYVKVTVASAQNYVAGGLDMSDLFVDLFGISYADQIDSIQIRSGGTPANPIHGKWVRNGQFLFLHSNRSGTTQANSELGVTSVLNWVFMFKLYQRVKV